MSDTSASPPPPDVDESGITEIAPGVWVIPDRRIPLVPNIGVVVGSDAALVVDTGMGPVNGTRVLAAATDKAGGRPLVLTITHFHPEHGFGAQVFSGKATGIYNRAQLDELHAKGTAYLEMFRTFGPGVAAALEGVEIVDPDETYDGDAHEIDLGGRTAQLHTWGLAHTQGDQIVFLPDRRVMFTGDLVEACMFPIYPFFPPEDVDVDGSAWIEVLRHLEQLEPEIVVPGHGELGGAGLITTAREYHELLRRETFALADQGLSADEAVGRLEPEIIGRYPDWEQPEWVGFGIRCFHAVRTAGA